MENQTLHARINERGLRQQQLHCPHTYTRVTWSASHLTKIGFGGYFEIGVFDTSVMCTDCNLQIAGTTKELPLCQSCLKPMRLVSQRNDQIEGARLRFKTKQKRDWQTYCRRMDCIEAEQERRQPPHQPAADIFERMQQIQTDWQDSMMRIFEGSSRQQVWPYHCTNRNCSRYDRAKFLHTPGD